MGQKGHIMDQKGLKCMKKAKNRVLKPKIPVFSLAEMGVTPPPPLTDKIR